MPKGMSTALASSAKVPRSSATPSPSVSFSQLMRSSRDWATSTRPSGATASQRAMGTSVAKRCTTKPSGTASSASSGMGTTSGD